MIRAFSVASLAFLAACSGGTGSTPDGGTSPDGGTTNPDGGVGACTVTTMPSTVIASYTGLSLSVVGQDAYYIDRAANNGKGALHHVSLDGTNDTVVISSVSGVLLQATAIGSDIFYVQGDMNGDAHLFKTSRAMGGEGTQIGSATFNFAGSVLGGLFGIFSLQSTGVFAVRGSDLFVNDRVQVSRVSMAGTKSVLTNMGNWSWPTIVGNNVVVRDASGNIFSFAADAMGPSAGTPIGTQKCGTGNFTWMSASATPTSQFGFACGDPFGIAKLDGMATMKTMYIDTMRLSSKDMRNFNPSPIDGAVFYALPALATTDTPIYKVDTTTSMLTPVTCAARYVVEARLTATDLVYVEGRGTNTNDLTFSLKRLAR